MFQTIRLARQPVTPERVPAGEFVDLPGRGRTFAVDVPGPPGAPTLLLLHGLVATAYLNWFPAFGALSQHFRVVAMDLRGHGRGIPLSRRFRFADCADDAAALADAMRIDRFIPVGYSLGGVVAQLLWRRHPERVEGLVLCATSRNFGGTRQERWFYSTLLGAIYGIQLARYIPGPLHAKSVDHVAVLPPDLEGERLSRWALAELRLSSPIALLQAMNAMGRFSSHAWASEIEVPTAVVVTTLDSFIAPNRQLKLARAIPNATIHPCHANHAACVIGAQRFVPALVEACLAVKDRLAQRAAPATPRIPDDRPHRWAARGGVIQMQRLSGIDSTFLSIETPSHHMHVSMVATFDPSDMPGGYSFEKVRGLIESRLPRIPMFRRRLAEVPFNLHFPVWVEDPDFELDYHVRRVAAPTPGGMAELCVLAGEFTSHQLDRTKPLWEMQVVEGLAGGHIGMLAKVHHSTIDGVSGAEMMVHLFDLEPSPVPQAAVSEDERTVEHVPSDLELVAYAVRSIATQPFRLVRLVPATIGSVVGMVRQSRQNGGPGMAVPFTAPRTPFNAAITSHRSVAVARLSLDEIKRVKKAFGTTVNDVVLTLCAGALRRYLDRLGELPEAPLISVVPISVRGEDADESTNQVSAMFVSLATNIADPVERLRAIAEGTKGAKEQHKAIGASMLQDWAQFAAPAVFARASRLYSSMKLASRHRPIHNVIISNVPGPPFPLYLAGARLVLLCPLGPVMEGAGLNITVMSYLDSLDVGMIACRELMPDLADLATCFDAAAAELLAAAN